MENEKRPINISVIGFYAVGKTSLIMRFCYDDFKDNYVVTLSNSIYSKDYSLKSGEVIEVDVQDTAGQERFKSMTTSYLRNSQAVLVVYAINDEESFQEVSSYIEMVPPEMPKMIVGNKSDKDDERKISQSRLKEYAEINNCLYIEVSALNGNNVNAAFGQIIELLEAKRSEKKDIDPPSQSIQIKDKKEKPKCC